MIDKLILKFIQLTENQKITSKDKIFLFRQLAYLVAGGVSITDALQVIWSNTDKFSIKYNTALIYDYIKSWESFSKSLSRIPKYFDETDISIIRSGESTGNLTTVLHHLANEYEFINDIKSKYISAMIYPSILLTLSIAAVGFLFTFVLPSIFELVQNVEGAQIPGYTLAIMAMTNFVVNYNIYILLSIAIFVLFFGLWISTNRWYRIFFEWIIWLPWIGPIVRNYHMVKFFRYMKLMYSSWISYLDIFFYLQKIMDNPTYTYHIENIIIGIRKGQTIYDNLKFAKIIIPGDAAALIQVWETTANIPNSIDNIINIYDKELKSALDNLNKIIEPVMVVLVGCVIGLIAGSVFGIIGAIMDTASAWGL